MVCVTLDKVLVDTEDRNPFQKSSFSNQPACDGIIPVLSNIWQVLSAHENNKKKRNKDIILDIP